MRWRVIYPHSDQYRNTNKSIAHYCFYTCIKIDIKYITLLFEIKSRSYITFLFYFDYYSKIEEELNSESAKRKILGNQKAFNEKYCILCCCAFSFLFNKKLICKICKFHVCRNCALFEDKNWICRVCEKQRYFQFLINNSKNFFSKLFYCCFVTFSIIYWF